MFRRIAILLFAALVFGLCANAASVKLTESPARGKRAIEVGDVFYIYIEVTDLRDRPSVPSSVPGAKILYFDHTAQMSQMTSVNGNVRQSTSDT